MITWLPEQADKGLPWCNTMCDMQEAGGESRERLIQVRSRIPITASGSHKENTPSSRRGKASPLHRDHKTHVFTPQQTRVDWDQS